MPHTKEKKRVLLIGTGGTIASEVTDGGLAPELTTEQLLNHVPGISEICAVDCLQLLNLDSTNIGPAHWLQMARCLREHYGRYDGFVLTHGTDTMAYTAAALSYLVQGSPKPIVLTGAQKPIGFDSTRRTWPTPSAARRRTCRGSPSFLTAKSFPAPGRRKPGPRASRPFPALITPISAFSGTGCSSAISARTAGRSRCFTIR